jgi:hypothetical protein
MDFLDHCKGFLAGTTNPLFLSFPKAKADLVINLDADKVDFPSDKAQSTLQAHYMKYCRLHTTYEKKLVANIVKQLDTGGQASL